MTVAPSALRYVSWTPWRGCPRPGPGRPQAQPDSPQYLGPWGCGRPVTRHICKGSLGGTKLPEERAL